MSCALFLCLMLFSMASWCVRSMPAISALDQSSKRNIEIGLGGGVESVLNSASKAQEICLKVICAGERKSSHVTVYFEKFTTAAIEFARDTLPPSIIIYQALLRSSMQKHRECLGRANILVYKANKHKRHGSGTGTLMNSSSIEVM
ncbi:hypothetical protein HD554DRAFT_2044126, partial [Boletus coccyginus]